ncbi:hypothetical protein PUP50_17890 [Pseudomonas chlororaphis]|nr:hypothetical protein [Pseudomonas chlororaphis]WDH19917.1 hypothetical protein PUP50_17890 [Pseudomonas chlororaphis]
MESLDEQLHGYRQGHQLLSSTIRLAKDDQDLVDRLSDIAGPLGPSERFSPYITCYPLPSSSHYVIARTWQDLDVPRAGCVRTRSLMVPMHLWEKMENVAGVVDLVSKAGGLDAAKKRALIEEGPTPLAEIDPRLGIELVEALFLEDRAPIVVFDAEFPEILTLRIVTALWPSFRRNFAVSTFCRSPRSLGRRSFDLVFAPKDARSRFSDWPGRRVDGRKKEPVRHQWSRSIVERVLDSPYPSLKMLDTIGEMSADGSGSETALRVSLLWEELKRKSNISPNAALGLLDIANTRSARNINVIRSLEPVLIKSARMAVEQMMVPEAWRFLKALVSKLDKEPLSIEMRHSISQSAALLASTEPEAALDFAESLLAEPIYFEPLIEGMGAGLALSFRPSIGDRLVKLTDSELLRLVLTSSLLLKTVVQADSVLPSRLTIALSKTGRSLSGSSRKMLMPLLAEDAHATLARLLFSEATQNELEEHLINLYRTNGLESAEMRGVLIECATRLGVTEAMRRVVSEMRPSKHIDSMLEGLIGHQASDLDWILSCNNLNPERRQAFLYFMLSTASTGDLKKLISSLTQAKQVLDSLDLKSRPHVKLLSSILRILELAPIELHKLIMVLLPHLNGRDAEEWTLKAIDISLKLKVTEISAKKLAQLLNKASDELSGSRVFAIGLHPSTPSKSAERNIEALQQCKGNTRKRLLEAVDEMANQLIRRIPLDLSLEASGAAAAFLWESDSSHKRVLIKASAKLLPYLLNQPNVSASPLIAAAFPAVYRELAKETPPDFLSMIFRFGDWDKCKTARRSLIDAFMNSNWRLVDIATAAARAGDTKRILEIVAKKPAGHKLLESLHSEIEMIPAKNRNAINYALLEISEENSR